MDIRLKEHKFECTLAAQASIFEVKGMGVMGICLVAKIATPPPFLICLGVCDIRLYPVSLGATFSLVQVSCRQII